MEMPVWKFIFLVAATLVVHATSYFSVKATNLCARLRDSRKKPTPQKVACVSLALESQLKSKVRNFVLGRLIDKT